MKIAIGADHRGFDLKQHLVSSLDDIAWVDVGCDNADRSDFPRYVSLVAKQVQNKEVDGGILICGSGIGMSIAANRFDGVYAALVWNKEVARSSKEHNNANILVIPSDYVSKEETVAMIKTWQQAKFLDDRHQTRIDMIDKF
jgi:ribose 5-phosphate isomerase B